MVLHRLNRWKGNVASKGAQTIKRRLITAP